jgi:hypothetical protein
VEPLGPVLRLSVIRGMAIRAIPDFDRNRDIAVSVDFLWRLDRVSELDRDSICAASFPASR